MGCVFSALARVREGGWESGEKIARDPKRLSEKKAPKGLHWNFAYWPRGNAQVCIFVRGEFVFLLRRPISVALLLLSHTFE